MLTRGDVNLSGNSVSDSSDAEHRGDGRIDRPSNISSEGGKTGVT